MLQPLQIVLEVQATEWRETLLIALTQTDLLQTIARYVNSMYIITHEDLGIMMGFVFVHMSKKGF